MNIELRIVAALKSFLKVKNATFLFLGLAFDYVPCPQC